MLLSTAQCVEAMNETYGTGAISAPQIRLYTQTGALHNVSTGRSIKIDSNELTHFLRQYRYVTAEEWPVDYLYRVSLIAPQSGIPRTDTTHTTYEWSGADHDHTHMPNTIARMEAWVGVWPVRDEAAALAVQHTATLIGSARGLIAPDYVRTILGYDRNHDHARRAWWRTGDPTPAVRNFVGTGVIMPITPGPGCMFEKQPA